MKQNKKQIEANLRNKLAAQYKEKTEQLKEENAKLEKRYNDLWRKAKEIEAERDELKEKVAQFEDWNRRLQEFMDMDEKDRLKYVETLRAEEKLKDALKLTEKFTYFNQLLGMVF